jgi:AcrR family transcriptional regulator
LFGSCYRDRVCATDAVPTAWGDAEGRRRDILRSAERLLDESGYAALTVRAVAAGAGVSLGTVYQYFQGKEDLFVALMAARLGALQTTLAELDRSLGIAGMLRAVLPELTEIWRLFGRSAPQWESIVLASGRRSNRQITSATVWRKTMRALDKTIREVAAASGQVLVDDPAMPHWVWDALLGVADDLVHKSSAHAKVPSARLIEFATAALERSIVIGRVDPVRD